MTSSLAGTEHKPLSHRYRSEAGFGSQADCLIIVLLMGVAMAVLVPVIARNMIRAGQTRSARCIGNFYKIAEGTDPATLACPISGDAYAVRRGESGDSIACPDPKNHLGFPVYLVREGVSWDVRVDLPPPPPADSAGRVALGRKTLAIAPNEVRIETAPPSPLFRFVVVPLLILFVGVIFFVPLYWMLGSPTGEDIQGLMFFFILCAGLLSMGVLVRAVARSDEVVLRGDTRRIRLSDRYFGLQLTKIETLESVRGVYPASFHSRVGAVAIHERHGLLRYRILMETSVEDAGVFSYLSSVFPRD